MTDEIISEPIDWDFEFPDFAKEEIYSPLSIDLPHLLDFDSMRKLQRFRNMLRKPIFINRGNLKLRGVRTRKEQESLGKKGATNSMHVAGKAFDIDCKGYMSVADLAQAAVIFRWSCVIKYPTFVHVDNRDLWDGKQIIRDYS